MQTLTEKQANLLKPGTRLKVVVDDSSLGQLIKGGIVTFRSWAYFPSEVFVEENSLSWLLSRFSFTKTQKRDARGRFAPSKPVAQKPRQKPQALRPGSLYAVKRKRGYQIARLRSSAHKDFLVFSRHDKPFIARREQVALADKEEVQAYLAQAEK